MNVTIHNGDSVSGAIELRKDQGITGLSMPAAWTAASIQLEASLDGGTWLPMYDADGNAIVITTAASIWVTLLEAATAGARYVRLRSGTSAVPVNQGADRTIGVQLS